ncbi:MAG: flagellar basal body L-ring protein FlgH, partial [Bryobacteraceae bacterium]
MKRVLALALAILAAGWAADKPKKKAAVVPPVDQFVAAANARTAAAAPPSPGAIWSPASRLADPARDVRASQVDDILTVVVVENASAVATGTTKT